MPEDLTGSLDLEARLAEADVKLGDIDDDSELDLSGEPIEREERVSKKDLATSLGRRHEPEVDDEDEQVEDEQVEDETPPPADEEEEPQVDFDAELRKRAAAKGIDISKYGSLDNFLQGYAHLSSKIGEREQLAEYGRQLLTDPEGVLKHLQNALGKKEPPPSEEPPSDIPEFKEEWLSQIGEDGKALPGADPSIPGKLRKYGEWMQKRGRELALNPKGVIKPLLEKDFAAMAEKIAEQKLAQYRAEQDAIRNQEHMRHQAVAMLQPELKWICVDGDVRKLTPAGEIFKRHIDAAEQLDASGMPFIPNMAARIEYAKAQTYRELTMKGQKNDKETRRAKQDKAASKPPRASKKTSTGWVKGQSLEDALLLAVSKDE